MIRTNSPFTRILDIECWMLDIDPSPWSLIRPLWPPSTGAAHQKLHHIWCITLEIPDSPCLEPVRD